MSTFPNEFDFSEYPENHPLYSTSNMKVLGKMKDELHGLPLRSFRGLRPKLYCMEKTILKDDEIKTDIEIKGKGLTKAAREQQLRVESFEECLQKYVKQSVTQHAIRSDHHKLLAIK